MPEVLFDVGVDAGELVRALEAYPHAAEDLAQAFGVVSEDLVAAVTDRIGTSGDGAWTPNAPATIRRKGSSKPLVDSSQLFGSIQGESGPDWARASTSVDYIKYHLDGGDIIPKRNPFELDPTIFEEAARFIAEAVVERASALGGKG